LIEKEIQSILEKFFNCFSGRILLKKLSDLIEIKGFGIECYGCMTSDGLKYGDEDFFGYECVKITISAPANLNDVEIIVTNQVFYNSLKNRVDLFIKRNPLKRTQALEYLVIIKNILT